MLRRLIAVITAVLALCACSCFSEAEVYTCQYPATTDGAATSMEFCFDECWFDETSAVYSHNIAKFSISMAMAAFRNNRYEDNTSDVFIRSFIDTIGFEGYRQYGYDSATSDDTISNAIAYKRIMSGGGPYVLLLVPVCGQGYGNEWLSNFTIDDGVNHAGFESAAKQVKERIDEYIAGRFPGERIKLLVTGFSRAAAISNLVGDMLLDDSSFDRNDIFVYTFGTPNTTKKPVSWPQIHNICGSFDPVTNVPYTDWGYSKNGITHYLPALETDAAYSVKVLKACDVYAGLTGSSDSFGTLPERNWLINRILKLFCAYIPESSSYSNVMQDALKAAWNTEGDAVSKILNLATAVENGGGLNEGFERVKAELFELVNLGITDTVSAAAKSGGSLMWYELLSSGMKLAQEHFPEIYYSWLYSADDGNDLFISDTTYRKLIFTGDTSVKVYETDSTTGARRELINADSGLAEFAQVSIPRQTFISLPSSREYMIELMAGDGTEIQIGYTAPSAGGSFTETLLTTNELTLYQNDYVIIHVSAYRAALPEVLVNGTDKLYLNEDTAAGTSDLLMRGTLDAGRLLMNQIAGGTVLLLYLMLGVLLVFYTIVVILKRMIRGHLEDRAVCRPMGLITLIATALMSACVAVSFCYQLFIQFTNTGSAPIPYRTMQRASEYLGIGNAAYLFTGFTAYALLAVESILSIHNQLNRVRLSRLSVSLLIMNILTAVLSKEIHTIALAESLSYLVPVAALIAVKLAYKKGADDTISGIVWLPLSRTITWTAILFVLRQAAVWLFGIDMGASVALKCLTSIPVLLLAMRMYARQRSRLMKYNLIGVFIYVIANTVINLNVPLGVFIYVLGHICMTRGYTSDRPVRPLQIVIWVLLTGILGFEIYSFRAVLPDSVLPFALIYDAAMCAMLVTAFPLSGHCRFGTLLFLIANETLLLTYIYPESFTIGSVELLIFYAAVILMTTDPETMRKPWHRTIGSVT